MFGWNHKDEVLKAEQRRATFHRRLLEALQPIKRDWPTIEDSRSSPDAPSDPRPTLTSGSEILEPTRHTPIA